MEILYHIGIWERVIPGENGSRLWYLVVPYFRNRKLKQTTRPVNLEKAQVLINGVSDFPTINEEVVQRKRLIYPRIEIDFLATVMYNLKNKST